MNPNQPQNQWDPFGQKPTDQPTDGQPPVSPQPQSQQPTPPASPEAPQPQSQPEVPAQPTPTNPVAPAQNPVNPPAQPVPTAQPQPAAAGVVTPPPNGGGSKKKIILLASIIGGAVLLVGALLVAAYFMFFNVTQADYQEAANQLQEIDDISLSEGIELLDGSGDNAFESFEASYAEVKAAHDTLDSLKAVRGGDAELAAAYREYKTAYEAQTAYIDKQLPFLKIYLGAQTDVTETGTLRGETYREIATALREGAESINDQESKDYLNEAAGLYDRFAAEFDKFETAETAEEYESISENIQAIGDEFTALEEKSDEIFGDGDAISKAVEDTFNTLSELLQTRLN